MCSILGSHSIYKTVCQFFSISFKMLRVLTAIFNISVAKLERIALISNLAVGFAQTSCISQGTTSIVFEIDTWFLSETTHELQGHFQSIMQNTTCFVTTSTDINSFGSVDLIMCCFVAMFHLFIRSLVCPLVRSLVFSHQFVPPFRWSIQFFVCLLFSFVQQFVRIQVVQKTTHAIRKQKNCSVIVYTFTNLACIIETPVTLKPFHNSDETSTPAQTDRQFFFKFIVSDRTKGDVSKDAKQTLHNIVFRLI